MRIAIAIAALLSLCSSAVLAQGSTMYRCMDKDKRVTYSNVSCDKQGLTNSGVVVDRTSNVSMPPLATPKPPADKATEKPPAAPESKAPPPAPPAASAAPQVVEPRIPPNLQPPQQHQEPAPAPQRPAQQRVPAPRNASSAAAPSKPKPSSDADDIPPLPTVKPPVK